MAGLEQLRNVLHVIRAWLYPNYLEHGGKYIARARTEKTLAIRIPAGRRSPGVLFSTGVENKTPRAGSPGLRRGLAINDVYGVSG
ncbi:MAG: hypothetical protein LBU18_07190 [Treponema sp.]|jgi:hypothetical protein|nr:hypothetical protein [Treponema sp.]